jgi:hypothetical protein
MLNWLVALSISRRWGRVGGFCGADDADLISETNPNWPR